MALHQFTKFERTQWPVGHGGFHTGRAKTHDANFSYFYDCGAKSTHGKNLIKEKLRQIKFDFGVISHFDSDHYECLNEASVDILFLPYLTPVDILFCVVSEIVEKGATEESATGIYTALERLRAKKTRIIMVRHGSIPDNPAPAPLTPPDERSKPIILTGGLVSSAEIIATMSDSDSLAAVHNVESSEAVLLELKFFNHRNEAISVAFKKALEDNLGLLSNNSEERYKSVDEFLDDVKEGKAAIIRKNASRLQAIYIEALKPFKVDKISPSNLSSLALFSSSVPYSKYSFPRVPLHTSVRSEYFRQPIPKYFDGWLCTGDLELTTSVWPMFYEHYFVELARTVVCNVPHHGSKIAFNDEALAFLKGEKFFLFPVNETDPSHPAEDLLSMFERHKIAGQHRITSEPETAFSVATLW